MASLNDLLDFCFDGRQPAFYAELEGWLRSSRRFQSFVDSHCVKIRAKLKSARDEAGLQDVRAELLTAALLLSDDRFTLEYEKYVAAKQRGPDFTVTFKTHTPFNVEVRRMRRAELQEIDADARTNKLIAVLCDKVGQMPPSIVNLLWLVVEAEISEADLAGAVTVLQRLAESKAEAFFIGHGFKDATHFLRQYGQLSGIVLHQRNRNAVWLNPVARHKAPLEIMTAIRRLEIG